MGGWMGASGQRQDKEGKREQDVLDRAAVN